MRGFDCTGYDLKEGRLLGKIASKARSALRSVGRMLFGLRTPLPPH